MLKVFKDKNTAEQNCTTLLKAMELSSQESALALVPLFESLDLKAAVLKLYVMNLGAREWRYNRAIKDKN